MLRRAVLGMLGTGLFARGALAQVAAAMEPGLARYREANASLPPATARRVVFMGDSITEGWQQTPAFGAEPDRVGRGISGQTAIQMRLRFRQDVIGLRPRIVHIMAGTNDIAGNLGPETDEEYQAAIRSMVEMAQAAGITVILATIPPADIIPWRPGLMPVERLRRLNGWLKAFAAERRAIFADYWPALATPEGGMKPGLAGDHVHPTAQGFAAMQPVADAAIARAFAAAH